MFPMTGILKNGGVDSPYQSIGIPPLLSSEARSICGERSVAGSLESNKAMETIGLRVSRMDIERLWTSVGDDTSDPHAGIFGPSSISWNVNRESALFLGAGRAALLQLAHPWVAAALHQHSNLRTDPLARFHNTFRVVFTMVFGTLEQALASSRHLYQLHTRIQGQLPESVAAYPQGAPYEANELKALLWVYATLVESALLESGGSTLS